MNRENVHNKVFFAEIKPYGFSNLNRDENGFGKEGVYLGTLRARTSSQCLKSAYKDAANLKSAYRTSQLGHMFNETLIKAAKEGKIEESEINTLGKAICYAMGCKWPEDTAATEDPKDAEAPAEETDAETASKAPEASEASEEEDEKGNTVIIISPEAFMAIVDAVIDKKEVVAEEYAAVTKTQSQKKGKKKKAKLSKTNDIIKAALDKVPMTIEEALCGTTATNGVLGTVDGALEMSHAMSINELSPENDYITARFSAPKEDISDPFYGGPMNSFKENESSKTNAETIANAWLSSNVMYISGNINLYTLMKNMKKSIGVDLKDIDMTSEGEKELRRQVVSNLADLIEVIPDTDPSGNQHSMSTHPMPSIFYIEFIENGKPLDVDFEKAIRPTEKKTISEQGIEKFFEFAKDNTFRRGTIRKYAMFPPQYKSYEKMFEDAGIGIIHSLNELRQISETEIERLI